jgi:hypothetical protein
VHWLAVCHLSRIPSSTWQEMGQCSFPGPLLPVLPVLPVDQSAVVRGSLFNNRLLLAWPWGRRRECLEEDWTKTN